MGDETSVCGACNPCYLHGRREAVYRRRHRRRKVSDRTGPRCLRGLRLTVTSVDGADAIASAHHLPLTSSQPSSTARQVQQERNRRIMRQISRRKAIKVGIATASATM